MKHWVRSSLARSLPVLATPLLALGALAAMTPASVASASVTAGARPAAQAAPAVPASLRAAIRTSLGAGAYARQTELAAADGAANDEFGYSVALSGPGTTALVGAWERDNDTGAAYVFRLRGGRWSQTAELTAPHGVANDEFGYSVALSATGATAVVGAPRAGSTGAAYVFGLRAGRESRTTELTAANGAKGDSFGGAVAVSAPGDTIVVGAFGANLTPGLAAGTGAAYVFRLRGRSWRQTAELTPAHGAPLDVFGGSVSVSAAGTTVLAGAAGHNSNAGAAYVFRLRGRTWSQTELTAPHPAPGDDFGISVSLSAAGSTALAGATGRSGRDRGGLRLPAARPHLVRDRPAHRRRRGGPRPVRLLGGPVRRRHHRPERGSLPRRSRRGGLRVPAAGAQVVPDRRADRRPRRVPGPARHLGGPVRLG